MESKSIKFIILAFVSLISIGSFATIPAYADICSTNAPEEVLNAAGCNNASDKLPSLIQNIVYSIIGVTSVIAVIFVVVGGINYMTSGGDPTKAQKAKNTIIYALIGLAICALSFAIVNFVIGKL